MSSRDGPGRSVRAWRSRSRTLASRTESSGSTSSCNVDAPPSKVPSGVTRNTSAAQAPSVGAERRCQLVGGPDVVRALVQVTLGVQRVGVQAGSERALGRPHLAEQPVDGLGHHPRRQRIPGTPPPVRVRRRGAGRCRRASSRSAAPPSRRRRCTGRTRHPAGRRCRPGPSPDRSGSTIVIAGSPPSRSSASSTIDGGNLGARPKPPASRRTPPGAGRSRRAQSASVIVAGAARSAARPARRRWSRRWTHLVAALGPGLVDRPRAPVGTRACRAAGTEGSTSRRRTAAAPASGTRSSASRPARSVPGWPACRPRPRRDAPHGPP